MQISTFSCLKLITWLALLSQVDGILKAVLRDEIIAWHKKTQEDTSIPLSPAGQPENMDSQQLVSLVQKAVTAIMTRLHNLAQFEGGESKVNTLVAAANSLDNLCRMDPAWHPWLWESRGAGSGWRTQWNLMRWRASVVVFLSFFFYTFVTYLTGLLPHMSLFTVTEAWLTLLYGFCSVQIHCLKKKKKKECSWNKGHDLSHCWFKYYWRKRKTKTFDLYLLFVL